MTLRRAAYITPPMVLPPGKQHPFLQHTSENSLFLRNDFLPCNLFILQFLSVMLPSGYGNDCLSVGGRFVISLYGTNDVFTAEGECLRVRDYRKNDASQIWICQMNKTNRYGFRNEQTRRFLGRDKCANLVCTISEHLGWECLTFTKVGMGGYALTVPVDDRLCPTKRVSDPDGPYMKVVDESNTQIGLHQLNKGAFRRFEWVIPGQLARSSAPYYNNQDSDQHMDSSAVRFLVDHGIQNIISLNSEKLSAEEQNRLRVVEITYNHIGVVDFTAPTREQFDLIHECAPGGRVTLVYCGYGHGRTGSAISALQLYYGRRMREIDFRENRVEDRTQYTALQALQRRLHE